MYSDINIILNSTNTNIFNNYFIVSQISRNINMSVKTAMLTDFILLEREERKRLSTERQDNLINVHNSYSVAKKIIILDSDPDIILVNFDFNIASVVKELFWTLEFYINDFLINDTTTNQNSQSTNFKGLNDIILSTIFYIDGNKRDGINPITGNNYNKITTIMNGYKYNTKELLDANYNIYSFALFPEKLQPTGAFNMNVINNFTIQLVLDKKKFMQYFANLGKLTNNDTITIKMNLETLEYNIIRYQSGIAGLLFLS
jgi:hypothetical protein